MLGMHNKRTVEVGHAQQNFNFILDFLKQNSATAMAEYDGAGPELSEEPGIIKIGSRIWKIGDKVYSKGAEAVEKAKMVETFGGAWKTALVEGEVLGKGRLRKVLVQWNSFSTPHIQEYGYQHSIFKSSYEDRVQKPSKKRSNSEISSEAPRVTGTALNEIC